MPNSTIILTIFEESIEHQECEEMIMPLELGRKKRGCPCYSLLSFLL